MIIYSDSEVLYLGKFLNQNNVLIEGVNKIEDFNLKNINIPHINF